MIDSIGQPIANSNLIAKPQIEDAEITFSITDESGRYKLNLVSGVPYKIEIISLGFGTQSDSLTLHKDTQKNYTMLIDVQELETVIIEAKMAMIVKKDTTIYRVDNFRTGEERKLRDLLQKLPGAEIDKDGNVKINGKTVTKLMVDGKDFFGGSTKLGVNNIPADAVEEVVAIDHYHEVAFMKGLSDSDRLALNIKLKKGKKRFLFGESEAGGGVDHRYYLHPTLFYYSPKTTLNFIGSLNNVNQSPLSFDDVLRFRGGYSSIMDSPINSKNQGLTQFSTSENIRFRKNSFGAFNVSQQLSKALRIEAYSIVSEQKQDRLTDSRITYLTENNSTENRAYSQHNKSFSNFNKLRLRYKPNLFTDIAYHINANVSHNTLNGNLQSRYSDSLNLTNTLQSPDAVAIDQYFRLNSQPTYKHTSELKAEYHYSQSNSLTNWDFDRPVFAHIIPAITEGDRYNFIHDYASTSNSGQITYKHYWVIDNGNHLYPIVGLYYFNEKYRSTDYQRLQNGTINSFKSAGFDNDLVYQLFDPYIGFQYKFRVNNFISFKPGLVYHYYNWTVNQFNERLVKRHKGVLLPEFHAEYDVGIGKDLELDYHLKANFSNAKDYANRLRLVNFNQLFRGNTALENALYHDLSIRYSGVKRYKRINYNIQFSYTRKEKSIRPTTQLEGINQVQGLLYTDLPENTYSLNVGYGKLWPNLILRFNGRVRLADYSRVINTTSYDYTSQYYAYRIFGRTTFDDLPNFSAGFTQRFSISSSDDFKNRYTSIEPYIELEYDFLKGFVLTADYHYTYDKDISSDQDRSFQSGNASLFYRKDGSPWGFEVRVNNVFDIRYKRSHSFDQFMIYDQYTYIQPRTALFILSYQL